MAQTTPNMQLTVWNNLSDPYDSGQLADNFVKIDLHDHDGSKGVQLDGAKAILANTIGQNEIGGDAIGSDELQNDSVGTDHIKDLAISNDKIANNTLTRGKFSSNALTPPIVYHRSDDGSLPSVTEDGSSLYDGYIIDYAFDVAVTTSTGFTKSASLKTDANYQTYIWRLRYNKPDTITAGYPSWDYIGGAAYQSAHVRTIEPSGTGPNTGDYYIGWGSTRFQTFNCPLKGDYLATSQGQGQITGGANRTAVFSTGVFVGSATVGSPITPIVGTRAYSYLTYLSSATGDQTTVVSPDNVVTVSSNVSSGNVLRQAFGYSYKSGDFRGDLLSQKLVVTPYRKLTNF